MLSATKSKLQTETLLAYPYVTQLRQRLVKVLPEYSRQRQLLPATSDHGRRRHTSRKLT